MGKLFTDRQKRELNEKLAQIHYNRILGSVPSAKKYKTNKRIAQMRIKYSHLETLNKKNSDDI